MRLRGPPASRGCHGSGSVPHPEHPDAAGRGPGSAGGTELAPRDHSEGQRAAPPIPGSPSHRSHQDFGPRIQGALGAPEEQREGLRREKSPVPWKCLHGEAEGLGWETNEGLPHADPGLPARCRPRGDYFLIADSGRDLKQPLGISQDSTASAPVTRDNRLINHGPGAPVAFMVLFWRRKASTRRLASICFYLCF